MSKQRHEPFDLEVMVPVHPEGRWLERAEAFRRFGLLNIGTARVRVVLLAGRAEVDAALTDVNAWEGVEQVRVMHALLEHPAPKIYSYYSGMGFEEVGTARWFLRVDDDSVTDVGGLLAYLDGCSDWREPHHLVPHMNWDIVEPYEEILRDVGGAHLLTPGGHGPIGHEWEASLTSQGALLRALSNPSARELLQRAALCDGGFGDHCLAYACRLAGIHPAHVSFLSSFGQLEQFSLWGGGLFHIHYISPDNETMWGRYMDKLREHGLASECLAASAEGHELGDQG